MVLSLFKAQQMFFSFCGYFVFIFFSAFVCERILSVVIFMREQLSWFRYHWNKEVSILICCHLALIILFICFCCFASSNTAQLLEKEKVVSHHVVGQWKEDESHIVILNYFCLTADFVDKLGLQMFPNLELHVLHFVGEDCPCNYQVSKGKIRK